MTHNVMLSGGAPAILTTEHAASSYGVPVLVIGDAAYGPADPIHHDGSDWAAAKDIYVSRMDSLIPDFDPMSTEEVDCSEEMAARAEFERDLVAWRGWTKT